MDPIEEANPNLNLLFVNSTGPAPGHSRNETTKRRIRQHVMRDIGKSRRKPPRNPQIQLSMQSSTSHIKQISIASLFPPTSPPEEQTSSGIQPPPPLSQSVTDLQLLSPPRPFWDQHPLALMEINWAMDAFAAYGLALAVNWEKSLRGRVVNNLINSTSAPLLIELTHSTTNLILIDQPRPQIELIEIEIDPIDRNH
ncbi:hypothetical protein PT974_04671 [Cladobotryum mycophilum]|uniref:Uncharacterized protein n=1 Tax=Cladobotryum mycophilum TaxID=491253 RepID=A0ABR0SVT1_9HYPO